MRINTPTRFTCVLSKTITSTSTLRTKPLRSLLLLGLIAVATMALTSTVASAGSLRQLMTGLGFSSAGRNSQPKAELAPVPVNSLFTEAPLPNTLTVARRAHTATLLTDGRVLIVGGENGGGLISQSEIFDPAAGTFSVAGNLGSERADHSATRLADGRLLIAGGRGPAGSLTTTEIFDPTTGTFASGPAMSVGRAGHSATLFADGRVLIAGGDSNGTAELLDVAAGSSTAVGAMSSARSGHSAALMLDGRVLIVGGRDAGGNELSTGEIYDTPAGTFFAVDGTLKVARLHAHLRVLFDGKVQIIGGSNDGSMEIYDPLYEAFGAYAHVLPETDTCAGLPAHILASQTRSALFHNGQADSLLDRTGHTITELNGQALVVGGVNSSGAVLDSFAVLTSSSAAITTDKLDYAPGEIATISGRGFQPGETVRVKIHEDPHTPQERGFDATADADGNFSGEYLVVEYDLNMKFIVGARGLTSGATAQTTFTDNRAITAASVNGGATTTVAAGATITATVTVDTTTAGGGGQNWFSTSWRFATTSPGGTFSTPCADTPDHNTVGTFTEAFSTTAPTTPGTYNAYFLAWRTAGCGNNPSNLFVLPNAVIVEPAATKVAFAVQPTNTNKDATITPAVTVRIESATGSLVTTSTRNVSLAIGTNPGGGTLSGTTTVAAVGGIATFSNLSINNAGTGYTLVASSTLPAPALATATSSTFNINKLNQSITFAALADKTYGDAAFVVSASGGPSGNSVTFAASPVGVCTSSGANGSTITIVGAGSCTVTASQAGNSNYNAAPNVDQSFTVNPKTLTASIVGNPTKPYDGNANATLTPANFSLSGLVGSDSFTVTKTTGTYNSADVATATTVTTSLVAGDFTPGGGTSASNYNLPTTASGAGQITKANATIVVTPYNVTYDGQPHSATYTITGVNSETGATVGTVDVSGTTHTNAGSYLADPWSFSGTANYNNSNGTVDDNIDKANASFTVSPYNVTYDGLSHAASVSTINGVNGESGATVGSVDVSGTTHTNAGSYPGDPWSFTGTANYNNSNGTVDDNIDKADATVIVNGYSGTYDAAPHGATGTATGVGGVDLSAGLNLGASFTDYPGGTANWSFTGGTNYNDQNGTAAIVINKADATVIVNGYSGTYDAAPHGATGTATGVGGVDLSAGLNLGASFTDYPGGTANWSFTGGINYNDQNGTAAIVINKADAIIVVTPYNVTYDANPHTATGTATGVSGENLSGLNLGGTTHTNAGDFTDTWTFTDVTGNYNDTSGTVNDAIGKANATISVTPYSVTYDGAGHTATGTATGVLSESLSGLDLIATTHTNAGTYNGDAWTFTDVTGNYHNASGTVDDNISQASSATMVICPANVTYNGSAHTPCTASATGAGSLNESLTVNYSNNTDAGTATASASFAGDANHTGSDDSQDFSIDRRTLTAVIAGDPTKTYDGNTNATLDSANFSLGNLVAGQNITVTKTTGTYNSKDVVAASTVSTTLATGDFTAGIGTNLNNYNLPASASGPGHITPKALAITAENKSFLFGSPMPTLTATYNAFVSGEGVANLAGALVLTVQNASNIAVPYNASTPSGTYTIIPSGVTSTNYTITFNNGTLSIGSWTLLGFYQPVDMSTPAAFILNTVKGGSTVPLKFNIYAGTPGPLTERKSVTDVLFGSVQVAEYNCLQTPGYESAVDVTNSGSTSLRYDVTGAQFIQNWQTPKGANRCYQVRMTALDGSHLDAFFKTK